MYTVSPLSDRTLRDGYSTESRNWDHSVSDYEGHRRFDLPLGFEPRVSDKCLLSPPSVPLSFLYFRSSNQSGCLFPILPCRVDWRPPVKTSWQDHVCRICGLLFLSDNPVFTPRYRDILVTRVTSGTPCKTSQGSVSRR